MKVLIELLFTENNNPQDIRWCDILGCFIIWCGYIFSALFHIFQYQNEWKCGERKIIHNMLRLRGFVFSLCTYLFWQYAVLIAAVGEQYMTGFLSLSIRHEKGDKIVNFSIVIFNGKYILAERFICILGEGISSKAKKIFFYCKIKLWRTDLKDGLRTIRHNQKDTLRTIRQDLLTGILYFGEKNHSGSDKYFVVL